MKKFFLLAVCFIALATAPALAQGPAKAPAEEVAQVSASLKEAYGILSQDMARLGREIGPDATAASSEQKQMRERMQAALGQLESLLTTVNTVGDDQWSDAKAKAEVVRARALAIVEERKSR